MKTRFIKKQSEKAALLSFKNKRLDETTVKKFIQEFKKLPLNEAITSINLYLNALKRQLDKSTLIIESAFKVSVDQEKIIKRVFEKDYSIERVETKLSPSLLGGVKVKIADNVFDMSLRQRLNQVKGVIQG